MTGVEFIWYSLHLAFAVGAVAFTWSRTRNILHPHTIFTGMIIVIISDFLIRGYDDRNINHIRSADLFYYQATILAIFASTLLLAAAVYDPRRERAIREGMQRIKFGPRLFRIVFLIATLVVFLELYKRLTYTGWSLDMMIFESLQPRGLRPWEIAQYRGNFIYAIIRIIQPLAGVSFAFLLVNSRGVLLRATVLVLFGVTLWLLFTDGSRTPMVLSIAALWFFAIQRVRSLAAKVVWSVAAVALLATATSAMFLFRATGFLAANHDTRFSVVYHQDDSYYRALYAFDVASSSSQRWDFVDFFLAIAVNPIPRAFWPGKPVLDASFFGNYKLYYVTNTYVGETVAMFGPFMVVVFALLFGLFFYFVLYRSSHLLSLPMGMVAYLIVALYVYMCIRSMQNIVLFVYLPAAAMLLTFVLKKMTSRRRRSPVRRLARSHHEQPPMVPGRPASPLAAVRSQGRRTR